MFWISISIPSRRGTLSWWKIFSTIKISEYCSKAADVLSQKHDSLQNSCTYSHGIVGKLTNFKTGLRLPHCAKDTRALHSPPLLPKKKKKKRHNWRLQSLCHDYASLNMFPWGFLKYVSLKSMWQRWRQRASFIMTSVYSCTTARLAVWQKTSWLFLMNFLFGLTF